MESLGTAPVRVAIIGYGLAGKVFHAPLIAGVPGLQLASICCSKPDQVRADWPGVNPVTAPSAVFADPSVDLVVIATSNDSHHALARAALLAGKHVVIDKPFTVTLAETEDLLALAKAQHRVVTAFQNRRWDSDFLSLQAVLKSGQLGRIVHFQSHFDRFRAVTPGHWREQALPGSDLWMDLGAHLVDQCLVLFGAPDDLMLDVARHRDNTQTNDYFHAQLRYGSEHGGLRAILHASSAVTTSGPRFAVHGTLGSFTKYGLDCQEDALKAGGQPQLGSTDAWGIDLSPGTVECQSPGGSQQHTAPAVAGNYLAFYAQLHQHLVGKGNVPVSTAQIHALMSWLELGTSSATTGQVVRCSPT